MEWLGNSRKEIAKWPPGARDEAAFQLQRLIEGKNPVDWKPIKSVGPGVREIRIRERGNQYRIIYIAKIQSAIYVLHAFRKKTMKTPKPDIDLAKQRLQSLTHTG